ncbi:MAG: hypothetical protein GX837_05000 [Methanomicrobiales archaeon]|nr:hypothetical protein [Methanomicrobiales archaeon]
MKREILVALLLLMAVVVAPATAFSADRLQITVNEDASADITFNYTLSWIERVAVFFKIADPAEELKSALESALGVPVTVTSAKSDVSVFSAAKFATVRDAGDGKTYSTPGLDLTGAQAILDDYWFAPLVQADFSPDQTTVRFPDGYEETFFDLSEIPPLSHIVP